jgi:hypothetical protein
MRPTGEAPSTGLDILWKTGSCNQSIAIGVGGFTGATDRAVFEGAHGGPETHHQRRHPTPAGTVVSPAMRLPKGRACFGATSGGG